MYLNIMKVAYLLKTSKSDTTYFLQLGVGCSENSLSNQIKGHTRPIEVKVPDYYYQLLVHYLDCKAVTAIHTSPPFPSARGRRPVPPGASSRAPRVPCAPRPLGYVWLPLRHVPLHGASRPTTEKRSVMLVLWV